jgi:hypothetical protein
MHDEPNMHTQVYKLKILISSRCFLAGLHIVLQDDEAIQVLRATTLLGNKTRTIMIPPSIRTDRHSIPKCVCRLSAANTAPTYHLRHRHAPLRSLSAATSALHPSSASSRPPHPALCAPSPSFEWLVCGVTFYAPLSSTLSASSTPLRSALPASSTGRCRALRADEPLFAQAEGDVAMKSICFECFQVF